LPFHLTATPDPNTMAAPPRHRVQHTFVRVAVRRATRRGTCLCACRCPRALTQYTRVTHGGRTAWRLRRRLRSVRGLHVLFTPGIPPPLVYVAGRTGRRFGGAVATPTDVTCWTLPAATAIWLCLTLPHTLTFNISFTVMPHVTLPHCAGTPCRIARGCILPPVACRHPHPPRARHTPQRTRAAQARRTPLPQNCRFTVVPALPDPALPHLPPPTCTY